MGLWTAEDRLQASLVVWSRWCARDVEARGRGLDLLYAIPNGGGRSAATGKLLKATGVVAGIPDLHLPAGSVCGNYHSLYLETKTPKGRVEKHQKALHDELRALGNRVEVWRTIGQGARFILEHLGLPERLAVNVPGD